MKTTKKCKWCDKQIAKWLNAYCSVWCSKKKEKEKRAKIREKKKESVSHLTKELDKLWSEIVKIQWNHKCAYCWKTEYLNSHHLFTRSRRATRWDLNNWICLCSGCHTLSSEFSRHQTSLEFFLWLEEKFWRDWIDKKRIMSLRIYKPTSEDLKNLIEEYKIFKWELETL